MKGYTIDNIVRGTIMTKGYTIHHYPEFIHLACKFLREMNFDVVGEIKTYIAKIDSFKSVPLPKDFVDYNKIGILYDGKVQTIGLNEDLSRLRESGACQATFSNAQDEEGSIASFASEITNIYNNGYKVLKEHNRIQFDQTIPDCTVYIEYISDGGALHGNSLVHPYMAQAMEDFIIWKHKENTRSTGIYEKGVYRKEYHTQRRLMLNRLSPIDLRTILQIVRKNSHQGVKN
jgi:hypothetical protein